MARTRPQLIKESIALYEEQRHDLGIFCTGVRDYFQGHPALTAPPAIVHSVRWRFKSPARLEAKLKERVNVGEQISPGRALRRVTDLCGVRVLHLYQAQFPPIQKAIEQRVESGDWTLHERPVAYTWDPEAVEFFRSQGLRTELKASRYTSIHYVVKPRARSSIICEIQVRTLFEEIWGEIDHTINYPEPTASIACQEQLRVLSKLVGAGTRLADAIFRSHQEFAQD